MKITATRKPKNQKSMQNKNSKYIATNLTNIYLFTVNIETLEKYVKYVQS